MTPPIPENAESGYQHASHVTDFYLWHELQDICRTLVRMREAPRDFDFETEQREGWSL